MQFVDFLSFRYRARFLSGTPMGGGASRTHGAGTPSKRMGAPERHRKVYLFIGHPDEAQPDEVVAMDFQCLTTDCTEIPRPSDPHPICCFSELCLPFFLSPLATADSAPAGHSLPILALGRYEFGRVALLGSFDFFLRCSVDCEAHMIFVENLLRWAGGPSPVTREVLLYDFPAETQKSLIDIAHGLGFRFCTQESGTIDFNAYISIFVYSNCTQIAGIREFLTVGGAVICGPAPDGTQDRFAMNAVLVDAGLAFMPPSFSLLPSSDSVLRFPPDVTAAQECLLSRHVLRFSSALKDPSVETEALLTWLSLLRAQAELTRPASCVELVALCDAIVGFLRRSQYQSGDGRLGFSTTHSDLISMACLLFAKQGPPTLAQFELAVPFLGRPTQFVDAESVTLRITTGGWWSTGFWLPAGVHCRASLSRDIPGLRVQVGAHTRDLTGSPPPWDRWPALVVGTDATQGEFPVASPYGGLLYLMVEPPSLAIGAKSFTIEFSEVVLAPFFSYRNEDQWDITHSIECGWTEIQTAHLTFTVPTAEAREVMSIADSVALLTELFDSVFNFLGVGDNAVLPRVVVDVSLPPPGIELGYPIFVDAGWVGIALRSSAPTLPFLRFVATVGATLIPIGLFTPYFHGILALLAASHAFTKRWPSTAAGLPAQIEAGHTWTALSGIMGKIGTEPFSTAIVRIKGKASFNELPFAETAEVFASVLSQRAKRTIPKLAEEIASTEQSPLTLLATIHGTVRA
jgi:hypothetical protein